MRLFLASAGRRACLLEHGATSHHAPEDDDDGLSAGHCHWPSAIVQRTLAMILPPYDKLF